MWTRELIKTRAKAILKISYWKAFFVSLIIALVGGGSGAGINWNLGNGNTSSLPENWSDSFYDALPYLGIILFVIFIITLLFIAFRIFIGYPLEVGGRRYFIKSTQHEFDMNNVGFAFEQDKYLDIVTAMLWRGFINLLWFFLLIIPGIIKLYAYRMVPYILADNPKIGYKRALDLSVEMTAGQKFSIFILDLSFIGWYLLGLLACCVGIIFVLPYQNATEAELYLILRQNALDNGVCNREELLLEI